VGPCDQVWYGRSEGGFARGGCGRRWRRHASVRIHATELHVRTARGRCVLIAPARSRRFSQRLVHRAGTARGPMVDGGTREIRVQRLAGVPSGWFQGAPPASRGREFTHKCGGAALPGTCIRFVAPFIFFPLPLEPHPSPLYLVCVGSACIATLGTKSPTSPTCTLH
jgi:hypothetical protein